MSLLSTERSGGHASVRFMIFLFIECIWCCLESHYNSPAQQPESLVCFDLARVHQMSRQGLKFCGHPVRLISSVLGNFYLREAIDRQSFARSTAQTQVVCWPSEKSLHNLWHKPNSCACTIKGHSCLPSSPPLVD